jgi:glycosyl transferase family 25
MNNIDKIFIINLDKDVERMNNSINQLEKYGISNYERYSAIYGSKLSNNEVNNITTNIGKLLASRGMIGCGISHINIWKKIVKDGIKQTLILEDDFIFKDNFLNKFNDVIKKAPINYDIIFLSSNIIHNKNIRLYNIDENYYKQLFISQTVGYIISLEGARNILNYINKVSYHIDFELCFLSLLRNGINIISVKEALIYQTFNTSSNTNDRHYPLLINDIIYQKDINYFYKTTLFTFMDFNVSINSLIVILFGFLNFSASVVILLIEFFYFTDNNHKDDNPNDDNPNDDKIMIDNFILLLLGNLLRLLIYYDFV